MNCFSLWNCRGLKPLTVPSKVPFIQDLLREENQLFIALTETWLNEHKNAEMLINGYTLFRQDRRRERCRRGRNSGGVAVYMKSDIAADMETVINFSNGVVEVLGLYSKTKNLLLLVLYRQPDDVISGHRSIHLEFKQAVNKLREALSLTASPTPDILFCGDFNLPHVAWLEGHAGVGAGRDEQILSRATKGNSNPRLKGNRKGIIVKGKEFYIPILNTFPTR